MTGSAPLDGSGRPVLDRAAGPAASPGRGPGRAGGAARRATDRALPATVALAACSVAAGLGMGRLFSDPAAVLPVILTAVVAHALGWWSRRVGLRAPVAALASAAGSAVLVAWLVLPETTTYGVPTTATLQAASVALQDAWASFQGVVAPTPVTDGFLLAALLATATAALLADWAAFRAGATFEAALPSFAVVVFCALLGTDAGRMPVVAAWLGSLGLFVVAHQPAVAAERSAWFAGRPGRGPRAVVRGGALVAVAAVASALLLGPSLPGAGTPALLDWRSGGRPGGSSRVTVSPLVEIRGRLVERSPVEVFSVRASARSYWRLTALDSFDGAVWSSEDSYLRARERLAEGTTPEVEGDTVVQEFTLSGLASIWLPAAYRPQRLERADDLGGVRHNPRSSTLVADEVPPRGARYRVVSEIPRLRPEQLDQTPRRDSSVPYRYLRRPPVSDRVVALARQVAAEAATPYRRARALQDFFRRQFTYDLDVTQGHDAGALDNFLFSTRRGYCEQFAGAYAAMARLVGLPSRVAVGFTPGELGADGRYHVRGEHAHAWPEVYFQGAGWVAFEPTPGRGAPGAQAWTGVTESQDRSGRAVTPTTVAPTTTPDADSARREGEPGRDETTGATAPARPASRSPLSSPPARAATAVILAAGLWGLGVPAAKAVRRGRRRRAAVGSAARVQLAWGDAAEALALAGLAPRASETFAEYAGRADPAVAGDEQAGAALRLLAAYAGAAAYSQGEVSPDMAARAVAGAVRVQEAVRTRAPWPRRLRWALDPRPLLPRGLRQEVVATRDDRQGAA